MEANRDLMKRVPVREQDPQERAKNFKEVCLGYDMDEAMAEAVRCLNCKNARKGAVLYPSTSRLLFRRSRLEILRRRQRSLQSPPLFRLYAAVYARRRASARVNVSAESRESLYPSESWSVSSQTGRESMALFRRLLRQRTERE